MWLTLSPSKEGRSPGEGNSEWPFHNSESSSEHVFLSVLTPGAGATLSGEMIAKPASLAQQHRVIKDGNYSPESSVKARALSRHNYDSPLLSVPACGLWGLGSLAALCYGCCCWMLSLTDSSRWARLHAPELRPLQSCLTGPQAALRVGRWALCWFQLTPVQATHPWACNLGPAYLLQSSPAHTYFCGLADKRWEETKKEEESICLRLSLFCRTGVVTSNPLTQDSRLRQLSWVERYYTGRRSYSKT